MQLIILPAINLTMRHPGCQGDSSLDGGRSQVEERSGNRRILYHMSSGAVHPNKQNFIDGLDLIFGRWVALRMAVEMEWGGYDSAEKVEQFKQALVDYFDKGTGVSAGGAGMLNSLAIVVIGGKNIEAEDVEEILIEVMGSEFHTVLEDDSEVLV